MKNKLVIALAFVCALAGCRDPGADTSSAQGSVAGDGAEIASPRIDMPATKSLTTPLPGGIVAPSFDYHLNVDRTITRKSDGMQSREVGIELLGANQSDAEAAFTQSVTQAGGTVSQREKRGGSWRVVYLLSDGSSMLGWFRSGPPSGDRYALQRSDATGTVYLAWPYVEKSTQ